MADTAHVLAGKLLIVDDQAANVLLLEKVLTGAGYTSVASTRSPESVSTLQGENGYDLILLDLQMPGFDGFRVLDGLRNAFGDAAPAVLVMTAHPGNEARALAAGATAFVTKPLDVVEVLSRVYSLLEARLTPRP